MPLKTTALNRSRLPFELERMVVEIAARSHYPSMLHLLLVAHRITQWVEPIFYGMITLRGFHSASVFQRLLDDRPHIRRYVKTLCLTRMREKGSHPLIVSIIDRCPCLENFAFWSYYVNHSIVKHIMDRPLRRLSLEGYQLTVSPQVLFRERAFQCVTHLDILKIPVTIAGLVQSTWDFSLLPHLTHLRLGFSQDWLCLDEQLGEHLALPILAASPAMTVLLIEHELEHVREKWVSLVKKAAMPFDPRLVFLIDRSDATQDWKAALRGNEDTWMHGEEHVHLQRTEDAYIILELEE
ncbi:hypothetical protein PLICRDRAFT_57535 [Plicaturopsis crispa FD-325 SS-3]|uniref:F-box domain-containing protein n=1 Tax=Plicaturopsis crispa FD-325 SS-3 TaxID=944288 RepID=A0A0C9SXR5_PLICR|nr:hypothetical protein PLICRDRAFT_57535 [Plicaturopsis crispa FD-325 SS-3]